MRTFPALVISLLAAASLAAQSTPPASDAVEVRRVLVDATVTDRSGNPIIGLSPSDFVVTEDGTPVEVETVDYFTSRKLVRSELGEGPNIEEVREERYFVLFFHRYPGVTGAQAELMRARRDALQWIENDMLPGDQVAVVGHDVRLRVFSDFTSDPDVLRKALHSVGTFADGLESRPAYAGEVSLFDTLDPREVKNDTGRIYDSFRLLGEALEPLRARTVMLVFSQGFTEGGLSTDDPFMRPAIAALNRANVQVWAVEMPGLPDGTYQQNLARLAIDTGGEILRNAVNYGTALRNADKANAGYYLLSYRSPEPPSEGEYRRIEVELRNPEFKVTARPGYGG